MQYRSLSGRDEEGEVWSAGPLHGTVWVLRHPDRRPAVVHVAKGAEVEYTPPPPPGPKYPREVVEKAEDIRRRYVSHDPFLKRYRPPAGPKPTEAEVQAAQYIIDQEKAREEAEKTYRAHHVAATPIATKRLLDLAGIELPKKTRARKGETDE